jgi:hypothetical protein
MSSPPKYKPSIWRPDRLREAMDARGLDVNGLRALIARHRIRHEDGRSDVAPARKTVFAWLEGTSSPTMGRTGFECSVFEIADALDLSLDWLLGRVDAEPRVPGKRKRGGS